MSESCAWLVWYSLMPPDDLERALPPLSFEGAMANKRRSPDFTCAKLPPDEDARARRRGERLMQQFMAAPARMPPSDWRPKMAGLVEAKPRPPAPEHCMLKVVPPLHMPGDNNPAEPAFVPSPKGCPQ